MSRFEKCWGIHKGKVDMLVETKTEVLFLVIEKKSDIRVNP